METAFIAYGLVCVCTYKHRLQLTGKLQTCSPAEDSSYSVIRHTLVHPCVLVAVQTAYNEVAPRQTPPAIQAQIYESPIQ